MHTPTPLIYDIPLLAILVVTIYTDLAYKKIYNWITIPAAFLGIILHSFLEGWSGLLFSLIGCAVGAGIFFIAYLLGGVGGGDVKLVACLGALGGYIFLIEAVFYSALVGLAMAIIVMTKRGRLKEGLKRAMQLCTLLFTPVKRKAILSAAESERIPYGVAIVIGTFLVLVRKYLFF